MTSGISYLTLAWALCAGACAVIALAQFLLWLQGRGNPENLLAAVMSLAAAAVAIVELALMKSTGIAPYGALLQWENLAVFVLLVALVWYVRIRLNTPRIWLPVAITVLWTAALIANFASPYSVVFTQIDTLRTHQTYWGEPFLTAAGSANPWVILTHAATLLIIAYVVDATVRAWRAGRRSRAAAVGGSIVVFMLAGGIQAPLVDNGLLQLPYMISFFYLAIVFALAYELAVSARAAAAMQRQRAEALLEARNAREQMERIARASVLGELSAGIAHELTQPLAAILANTQAAQRLFASGAADPGEISEILADVVRDDKRAAEVIHRLRELLRSGERGHEKVDLAGLVAESVGLLRGELQAHGIAVRTRLGDTRAIVDGDRVALQQVVLNLLTNAMRALRTVAGPQRALDIALESDDGRVRLLVADRGGGIAPEDLPHLFEPYYSSQRTSLGMGLAICRRIVESHGGRIEAANRPGGGAELRVSLPRLDTDG
jgi:signal transduction histidine kinase